MFFTAVHPQNFVPHRTAPPKADSLHPCTWNLFDLYFMHSMHSLRSTLCTPSTHSSSPSPLLPLSPFSPTQQHPPSPSSPSSPSSPTQQHSRHPFLFSTHHCSPQRRRQARFFSSRRFSIFHGTCVFWF